MAIRILHNLNKCPKGRNKLMGVGKWWSKWWISYKIESKTEIHKTKEFIEDQMCYYEMKNSRGKIKSKAVEQIYVYHNKRSNFTDFL